jgi:hypothetical protein
MAGEDFLAEALEGLLDALEGVFLMALVLETGAEFDLATFFAMGILFEKSLIRKTSNTHLATN